MTVMFTSVPRLITQIKEARQNAHSVLLKTGSSTTTCDMRRVRIRLLRQRSRRIALQPSVSQSRKEISNHHYKPGLQQMERDYRRQSPRDSNGRPPDPQSRAHKHDRRILQNERNQENTPKSTIIVSNFFKFACPMKRCTSQLESGALLD